MRRALRITAHLFLFLLAVVAFCFGLGVGLQYNRTLGTALGGVAGVIVAVNLLWICDVWPFRRK